MAGVIKTVTPFLRGAGHGFVGPLNYERANEEIVLAANLGAVAAMQPLGQITVGGQYKKWDPAASDGSQNFAGFLWEDRPALTTTQRAVATKREATANAHAIVGWDALSTPNKAALVTAAKAMGIIILV
ncbi:MAG: head decoration protein [Rhizorhabdus sp.]